MKENIKFFEDISLKMSGTRVSSKTDLQTATNR